MVDTKNKNMQQELFQNLENPYISINDAAKKINVSVATIRNWLKTGYLKKSTTGIIEKKVFDDFIINIIGREKLNSRANKIYKDSHNKNELNKNILNKIEKRNIDSISIEYENILSNSYKNKEGIYYTPKHIIEDMLPKNNEDLSHKTFCDPCCGSGNFIIRALEIGFKPENIYGFDTDKVAIEITKKRIENKTGYISSNIKNTDFLEFASNYKIQFDYIFTNPPWGKKISKSEKEKYSIIFKSGKSLDTSSLFFFASLKCLKLKGQLGFLLPESFFNISTFEDARKEALNHNIKKIINYGKAFDKLITKAQTIILIKEKNKPNNNTIECINYQKNEFYRNKESFVKMSKSIFNFYCNEKDIKVIEHIFSKDHITLYNNAIWGLGIVTGNNKKYIKQKQINNYIPVYRGADITISGLKQPTSFIPKDFSLYQQVAPLKLYNSPKKIIYKFISSKLAFFYDSEQRYILNSANMLILDKKFPLQDSQLVDLFNSKIMNWIFKNIFNTHKILRSDLETLPIHLEYFINNKKFDEQEYLKFLNLEEANGTYRIKK